MTSRAHTGRGHIGNDTPKRFYGIGRNMEMSGGTTVRVSGSGPRRWADLALTVETRTVGASSVVG